MMPEDSNRHESTPPSERPEDQFTDNLDYWRARWRDRPSKWLIERIAIGEFVISIAGIVLLGIAGYFAWENWTELKTTNAISRQTYETSQRAYVTVNGLEIQPVTPAFWRGTPVIVNSGNTPTKNLWWTAVAGDTRGIRMAAFTFPDGHHIPERLTDGPNEPALQTFEALKHVTRNRLSIGPRQEARPLGLSTPLPNEYIEAIVQRAARIYVHGVLFYRDFITTQKHVTRYCYFLWHNEAVTGPGIAASTCGGPSNCSDEECDDYERLQTLVDADAGLSRK